MRLFIAGIALTCASLGFADTITLKNGSVIHGTYLGGTAREIRVDDGQNVQTLDVFEIKRIDFGTAAPAPAPSRPMPMRPDPQPAPPRAQGGFTLPAGTNIVVRMIDGVDSERDRVGQTFRASLDQPVMIDGNAVIQRGTDVLVKLVDAKQSGKLTGKTELALSLQSISVNGQMVDINTQTVREESSSRTGRTAKVAGGTAAVGAIIGAIAGGGKGAAIGAGAGAATGAGVELATAGQRVRVPSETRLTFVLDSAVRM
jgi:hypothetical protein